MTDGPQISADDLGLSAAAPEDEPLNLRQVRDEAEYKALIKALARVDGNIVKASELLGISRPTMYDLMSLSITSRRAPGSRWPGRCAGSALSCYWDC
ncbi:hypothetical protein LP419_18695 [Massilia sp. H-1]|nr:hypothetical protein LP419_18695 [Massilia sp. H-1]